MEAVEVANAVNSLLHLSSSDQQSLLARIISSLLINALMTVTWMALMTPILKWTLMLNLIKLIFIHLRIPVMSMGMQTHCSTVVHVQGADNVFVPYNLGICAISRLRCAFSEP